VGGDKKIYNKNCEKARTYAHGTGKGKAVEICATSSLCSHKNDDINSIILFNPVFAERIYLKFGTGKSY
jgi:hypothetical protein